MSEPLARLTSRAKSLDWSNQLIRRNPLYYGRFDRTLEQLWNADLEEREEFVQEKLRKTLGLAAKTPYGRGVGGTEEIESWPLLDKATVRVEGHHMRTRGLRFTIPAWTGGTTGIPLQIFRSHESVVAEQVFVDQLLRRYNVPVQHVKTGVLRGDTVKDPSDTEPPFWKVYEGGKRVVMSSQHLHPAHAEYYISLFKQEQFECLLAYPTTLDAFCRILETTGTHIQVPVVMTSSEVLLKRTQMLAARTLGCSIIDLYGLSERVAAAYSVNQEGYYFIPGYSYVELMDCENDGKVDLYEIVGTTLWNTSMPLIRYRTGDFVVLPQGTSEDERKRICYGVTPFVEVRGRNREYVCSPEGTRVVGINQIPRMVDHVIQMQVIQEEIDYLRVLVVPDKGFCDTDMKQIRQNVYQKIPKSMRLSIEQVEKVETTKQGKSPLVIRRHPISKL